MLLQMGARFADLPGTMMCGPEKARQFTAAIEQTHADGLLLNQQFGRTKHEHLMESLEIWHPDNSGVPRARRGTPGLAPEATRRGGPARDHLGLTGSGRGSDWPVRQFSMTRGLPPGSERGLISCPGA